MRMLVVGLLCIAGLAPLEAGAATLSTPAARDAIGTALGRALQGDITASLKALADVPASQFGDKEAPFRACMLDRFRPDADGSLPPDLAPLAARTTGIYRAYWRAALLNPKEQEIEAERLRRNLARLLGSAETLSMGELETELAGRLQPLGYHLLAGRTPPLRELMLWSKESREVKEVALPEGPHSATVVMLDGFASLGWTNYATCGRSVSGGWVKPDGIYAVRPGWSDLAGEQFLVSFLGHETQHFADNARFPKLESWELEYRAKLTEIALADASLPALLSAFSNNQGEDRAIPHSYANKLVLEAVRKRLGLPALAALGGVPAADLKRAAEEALREDSSRRLR